MAATVAEIVTLAEAKDQLGLDAADTAQDSRISGLLAGAVRYVENYTGMVLLDGSRTERFTPIGRRAPVRLRTRGIVAGSSPAEVVVRYLDEEQEEQTVMGNLYRGGESNSGDERFRIYPPKDEGWPCGYVQTWLGVEYSVDLTVRGPAANAVPADVKVAILLIMTGFYETGVLDKVGPDNPAMMILQSYKTDGK